MPDRTYHISEVSLCRSERAHPRTERPSFFRDPFRLGAFRREGPSPEVVPLTFENPVCEPAQVHEANTWIWCFLLL